VTTYFDLHARDVIARRRTADHVLYQYAGDIPLAIRVAQATRRPLLLLGDPGCGKSTLARDVAVSLGHAYIEEVITSRTTARELLWRFDHVKRLGDASVDKAKVGNLRHYVEPGPMWWAIDPASARRRGAPPAKPRKSGKPAKPGPPVADAVDPSLVNPGSTSGAVLLLDEIDKADPDVPNDLLVALGEYRFEIADPQTEVRQPRDRELLVFLTSNRERDLPTAFVRRCIPLELARPEPVLLKQIIAAHCKDDAGARGAARLDALIDAVLALLARPPAFAAGLREPGTAEAIDAVRACLAEKLDGPEVAAGGPSTEPADPRWEAILRLTLWKRVEPTRPQAEPR
jgi:MoxR-like ATPase